MANKKDRFLTDYQDKYKNILKNKILMPEKLITKSFERLLAKGQKRGFITYEELGKALGKRGGSAENTEKAFMIISDNSITLVEKKSQYQSNKKKENQNSLKKIFR